MSLNNHHICWLRINRSPKTLGELFGSMGIHPLTPLCRNYLPGHDCFPVMTNFIKIHPDSYPAKVLSMMVLSQFSNSENEPDSYPKIHHQSENEPAKVLSMMVFGAIMFVYVHKYIFHTKIAYIAIVSLLQWLFL